MRRLRVLVIGCAFASCSFLTTFDQDGQPCDKNEPNPALTCLSDAGYWCVNGFCKKGTGPGADGGSSDAGADGGGVLDAGTDAGQPDGGNDGG